MEGCLTVDQSVGNVMFVARQNEMATINCLVYLLYDQEFIYSEQGLHISFVVAMEREKKTQPHQ